MAIRTKDQQLEDSQYSEMLGSKSLELLECLESHLYVCSLEENTINILRDLGSGMRSLITGSSDFRVNKSSEFVKNIRNIERLMQTLLATSLISESFFSLILNIIDLSLMASKGEYDYKKIINFETPIPEVEMNIAVEALNNFEVIVENVPNSLGNTQDALRYCNILVVFFQKAENLQLPM